MRNWWTVAYPTLPIDGTLSVESAVGRRVIPPGMNAVARLSPMTQGEGVVSDATTLVAMSSHLEDEERRDRSPRRSP